MDRIVNTRSVMFCLAAFLLLSLPSFLFVKSMFPAVKTYTIYLLGTLVLFITINNLQTEKYERYAKYFFYFLLLHAVVVSLHVLYSHFILDVVRPESYLSHPNTVAQHLEMLLPVLVSGLLSPVFKQKEKLLFAGITVLAGLALIYTLTRGAWIGLSIALLVLFLINKQYKKMVYGLVCILIIVGLAIAGAPDIFAERWHTMVDMQFSSNAERINGWKAIPDMLQQYPLGVGFRNFHLYYPSFMLPGAQEKLAHAHNTVLAMATEAGIAAALAFTCFLGLAAVFMWRNFHCISNEYHRTMVVGFSCGLIALLLHGMVDYPLRKLDVLIIFMFELGYCLAVISRYQSRCDSTSVNSKKIESIMI